ncbi:MAG: replication/maintenance protein RepL [Candidatus Aenigmarchaeota archaeon]|nr:replication/maintenance protein RepL [Candidatus Aenigmarchaeota archaeon]
MRKVEKQKQVVDLETGEILDVVTLIPEAKDRDFTKVFSLLSKKALKDVQKLNNAVWVLFYIMNELKPYSNEVYLNPKILAKELKKSSRMIRIYLVKLMELGYISPVPEKKHFYTIDPQMIFKGRISKFLKTLK